MARKESFTYNSYVVGGAAPTATTQIVGMRFGWDSSADEDDETDEFVSEFIISGASRAALETAVATMRAALRTKNALLSVDFGGTSVMSYTATSGWDGRPRLTKSRRPTRDIGFTRGFEFRVRVKIPSNYVDANLSNAAANGRRTSSASMRWDTGTRRVVGIKGKFHLTASLLPRAQTTTAQSNNPTGPIDTYCVARLAKIDPAAEWTMCMRREEDNNTQTEMTFDREYYETIGGRFTATPTIGYSGSRLRNVSISGTFFRTYSSAYNGSATKAATVNYAAAVTGGYAFALTQLAALTMAQGGPLTVGTDCELVSERIVPNEQDDRLEYTLVFRQLNFKQSQDVSSGLDDASILNDSIKFLLDYTPLDDSPLPTAGGAGGPNPFKSIPSLEGSVGGKPAATSAPGTLDKSVVPPADANGKSPGTTSNTLPQKPVSLKIEYKAELRADTVTDRKHFWYTSIRPWLLSVWAAELGIGPTYLVGDHFDESVQENMISAFVMAVALPGDLIGYKQEEAVDDELGMAADVAMTGVPYEYLIQQECPERRKYRRHTATYKTSGSFDPSVLLTQTQIPGYMVMKRSLPSFNTKTVGIPALGIATQDLTTISFTEEMLYVARNVGSAPGSPPSGAAVAAPADNRTATMSGLGTNPIPPTNPGGV